MEYYNVQVQSSGLVFTKSIRFASQPRVGEEIHNVGGKQRIVTNVIHFLALDGPTKTTVILGPINNPGADFDSVRMQREGWKLVVT